MQKLQHPISGTASTTRLRAPRAAHIKGDWHFVMISPGLELHGGDSIEVRDDRFVVELPPGLSLTLLFGGSVDFAIGGRFCELIAQENAIQCCGFFLSQPEVLTRQLHRDRRVSKLTLFITLNWLETHCPQLLTELEQRGVGHCQIRQFVMRDIDRAEIMAWLSTPPNQAAGSLIREARVLELLARLTLAFASPSVDDAVPASIVTRQVAIGPAIERCKRLLDTESSGHFFRLESLARQLHTSPSTLQRHFKNAYGVTVMEYVRQRRMAQAGAVIAKSELPIDHVAEQAGYRHTENFITAFRRHYGKTPADFRRQHRRRQKLA